MMTKHMRTLLVASAIGMLPAQVLAQQQDPPPAAAQPAPPAAGQGQGQGKDLPPVEVIQKEPKAKAAPAKKAVAKKAAPKKKAVAKAAPAPTPPPPPPAPVEPEPVVQEPQAPADPNPVYGAQGSGPAAARAANGATSPVNPKALLPSNLENFASSATNVSQETLTERQPRNINEVFTRVPGAIVINDDGSAHHGGISIRGSPPRRSRKVLVMEDGQAINLALWLDPSVHYFAPLERIESVEVIRGTVFNHGPLNNFGVVNIRNLSPFGPNETVVSSSIGFTESDTGFFVNEDDEVVRGSNDTDISARWHAHTRQMVDNVGVVFSYGGENVQGSWDTERLRFNDFYGAIGWKGIDQDLAISVVYGRQRDNYDESNLEGEDDDDPGAVENTFFDVKHCKTCFAPGSVFNTYAADIARTQVTHNNYVTDDTTVTTRLYASRHRRDRYQIVTLEDNPADAEDPGVGPAFEDGDDGLFDVVLPEDSMFGRLRTFRTIGAEVRTEFANLPFVAGMSQDVQAGIRYENQQMDNRNFLGLSGQVLENGDSTGLTIFERNLEADTVSAFLQTTIKATSNFHVVPGVRVEWYDVTRTSLVTAEEEGEAEEAEGADCDAIDEDDCLIIEGINRDPFNDSTDTFEVLPGLAFSYDGFYRTTFFGGYHRGLSTAVLRNEDFPAPDEIGDNFQIGVRSGAIMGLQFEVAAFHQRLQDFQFGASFSSAGDRSFGRADEVEINGVEMAGRLNSQPFTGGSVNFFGEGTYTYSRAIIEKGMTVVVDEDTDEETVVNLAGKHLPEVPFHIAALTLGIENKSGWHWDASATYTYRGAFFTDEFNTPFGGDPEGENGEVPEIWLLSARVNLHIANTGASVFVSGDNLLDELYITDREDGLKPGIGRTIWTGFKYKF